MHLSLNSDVSVLPCYCFVVSRQLTLHPKKLESSHRGRDVIRGGNTVRGLTEIELQTSQRLTLYSFLDLQMRAKRLKSEKQVWKIRFLLS